ncbi:MAG: hypothetical protein EZS28_032938 [Streblomastix strix]|uniref:Uncharacterized protein n=1 Tax=Streblomastix strix TaxID=222440 RepID=A0A5J4UMX9_9EUKA|nr:MAG: hypothetical protein EZS28_032938 [Streblomastix strix]
MTSFEPITANITTAIEALESLHIDWHAIWKAIYEAGIKFACESKIQTETYPNIRIKSRDVSRLINKQLKYDFVNQLPIDAFRIETYDSGRGYYEFQNYYYYSQITDKFYSRNLLVLPISVQKKTGTQIVYLSDSNDRRIDNVILTKQDMKKLLDRDSDNRLIEIGYYYTSHLTADDYTKLWDKYKSWAEDENPNLYNLLAYQNYIIETESQKTNLVNQLC